MANFFQEGNKEFCCGCRACEQICPTNCIDMKVDEEGFLYPIIDKDKCIKCEMCEKVCPIRDGGYSNINAFKSPEVCAAYHKDDEVLYKSTSGGAFTAIAQAFCVENYVIFGAGFDEYQVVRHFYITDKKDLDMFRGSKYVQSDIGYSFNKVKSFLKEGKNVLFTGNPCQVAGLKSFLKKDYENLLCVDFVCHGVPSPKVFEQYKNYLEQKYKSKVTSINFRDKNKKNWKLPYMTIYFENGTKVNDVHSDNIFILGFYNSYYIRPVCHNCPFTKTPRVSDITIADFWGIEEISPQFANDKGTSLILINTNKGREVFKNMKQYLTYESADLKQAIRFNPQLCRPSQNNQMRKSFMRDFSNGMNFNDIKRKYLKRRPFVKRLISSTVNRKTKNMIKRILRMN